MPGFDFISALFRAAGKCSTQEVRVFGVDAPRSKTQFKSKINYSLTKPPLPPQKLTGPRAVRRRNLAAARRAIFRVDGIIEDGVLVMLKKLKSFFSARIDEPISESIFVARLLDERAKIGVGYFGAVPRSCIRTVVVIIGCKSSQGETSTKIGCVSFSTDLLNLNNVRIEASDISVRCSCRSILVDDCEHEHVCKNKSAVLETILDILSIPVAMCLTKTKESTNGRKASLMGNRETGRICTWLAKYLSSTECSAQL